MLSFKGDGTIKEIVLHMHPTEPELRKLVIAISFDEHAAGHHYSFTIPFPSELFNLFIEPENDGNCLFRMKENCKFKLKSKVSVAGHIKLQASGQGSLVLQGIKKFTKKVKEEKENGK